jgi:hypothetical protein
MDKVLGFQHDGNIFCYPDDIVICSPTFEKHVNLLKFVAEKLKSAGPRWVFRGSLKKLNSTQKLNMRGFRGHLPHSKTGIFKKIVGVLFEKTSF